MLYKNETMVKLLSMMIWKTENLPNEFADLAKKIPRQNAERIVGLFLFT